MVTPFASTPAWKMASPRETGESACRVLPTMSTAAIARKATARAAPAITRFVRRGMAFLEVA
jgi:hypothetical protein